MVAGVKLGLEVGAGLGLILYYSRTFSPPSEPVDPQAADQQAYRNAVAGVWGMVFAFLGVHCALSPLHLAPCATAQLKPVSLNAQ